ncbi:MAG: NAD(P)-dependent alcohol dehydrogenase [Candidatus Thorarchaeota archaeon]|nr:MAG: NAD(P)-dependent alcohol dehydrogenase [Candidatus Thorarchaeota archaeon]
MKAIVWTKYGSPDVLQLSEVEKPVQKDNEVLIRVHTSTVTVGDCEMRRLKYPLLMGLLVRMYIGFRKPKRITILGMELAGTVEAVGKDVTKLKPGDEVFAATGFLGTGAYAEYICLPEKPEAGAIAIKPENMSFVEAAAVPVGGLEALYLLKQANIQPGQDVLINGAAGTVGPFAIQISKYYGAEVTAIDGAQKLDTLRSIGSDHVIDYKETDFTKSGKKYDVIFNVIGKTSYSGCIRSLKENGIYLHTQPSLIRRFRRRWTSKRSNKRVIIGTSTDSTEDLIFLKELIEIGKMKSVIDRTYPLEKTDDAHRYVETEAKIGNVVITVVENNKA